RFFNSSGGNDDELIRCKNEFARKSQARIGGRPEQQAFARPSLSRHRFLGTYRLDRRPRFGRRDQGRPSTGFQVVGEISWTPKDALTVVASVRLSPIKALASVGLMQSHPGRHS